VAATPREEIARALSGHLSADQLDRMLEAAFQVTKRAWGSCSNCRKQVQVEVGDARAVIASVTDLLEAGFGKPQAAPADRTLTVNRQVLIVCEEGHECPTCTAEGLQRRSRVVSVNGEVVSRDEGLDAAA
jgi:hypothetical protein